MSTNSSQPVTSLTLVERALKESLHSPTFLDIKFYVFSRRSYMDDSGVVRIDKPRHVLAISSVLKKTDYFEKLLSSGFAESNAGRVPLNAPFPEDVSPYTDEYDYESDSDLEDEEPSDFIEDVAMLTSHSDGKDKKPSGRPQVSEFSDHPLGGTCQQIIIKDAAYHTWRAFIFYLYFSKVNFLPLKSEDEHTRVEALIRALGDPEAVPPSSPKSMYRLAEKYGITELQTLAFDAIRLQLSTKNIVREVFSKFTSRYEKVRELEIAYLRSHYAEVEDTLSTVMDRLVQGEFPYAGEVLKTLLNSKMETTTQPGQSSTSKGFKSPTSNAKPDSIALTRRTQSIRGNNAPPLFRSSYHALFSQPQSSSSVPSWTTFNPNELGDDDDY
ncbi:uncharacterized protein FIBRA_01865 [Fibroporia radiculosa]|uniref:BTB domain-containing protein n=1 Tax=Fibroporia radiculosa TaxID=599839 RepID=J4I8Q9_9APHY|nr:uncharacterized protein FIBRA_01865 [Fibroporia radiculosa]CCL99841.1 predicted protein [Fibroporia radiculosa]